ncbi:MAG TPA: SpoIIE family protein phosphatase [Spirochaetota bacterium]|nr:SpoIIE family protein phosphatase [Spirochaetota bacterium]
MARKNREHFKRGIDQPFKQFIHQVVHEWSTTLAALAFVLVPLFFILDYFTLPHQLLPKFAVYRIIGTFIPLFQYFIIKRTRPGKLSYIHGYLVSLVVGGVIAIMTIDLGGFESSYYAGINLVIIGVNLLLPWEAIHSAINGIILLMIYVLLNLFTDTDYETTSIINNLFFMSSTVIIAVSINYVRYKLIRQEFFLRTELRKARDALWGEMKLAKKIQTSILPKNDRLGEYQVAALMLPAEEVGGDYYDFFETAAGEKWVTIGDVSGHGVESGLIMMMTQTSIVSVLDTNPGLQPSKLLSSINKIIRNNIIRLEVERYMTLMAVHLSDKSITLAGKHTDMLILRGTDSSVEVISTEGTWIGITDDIDECMKDVEIPINRCDIILLYTDGVTEAKNADGRLFGDENLINSFKHHSKLPVNEIVQNILVDIVEYQQGQDDDITLLVIKKIF